MKRRLEQIDQSIARYLSQLDTADRQGPTVPEAKTTRLKEKIATLRQEIERLNALNAQMMASEDKQISLTDPDARSMATSGKGSGIVGYNVQCAVDTTHHLIVAHEVTNVGTDRSQLSNMAEQARTEIGAETLEVVADRGYYEGEEILVCETAGITVTLPKPMTSSAARRPLLQAGLHLRCRGRCLSLSRRRAVDLPVHERGGRQDAAPLLDDSLSGVRAEGSVYARQGAPDLRWQHEAVLETVQDRLDRNPDKMRVRRQTVEHPFGTIKAWMGATHFQMRTLPKVATEMALHVLAYNMKRVMRILGIGELMAAMRA
jgi:hypothetical protein